MLKEKIEKNTINLAHEEIHKKFDNNCNEAFN